MKMALLVVDVQQAFMEYDNFKDGLEEIIPYINHVSELFREHDMPVVFIRHVNDNLMKVGIDVAESLTQKENDIYINKKHKNAFWETELESILNELDVDFVIVSGFAVPYCVLSTYLNS